MIRNKHWSPFEMVDMCVEIVTSRAIAHQILRHWSFSFQEFSQRYASVNEFEEIQLRYQADKNRQSSSDVLSEKDMIEAMEIVNSTINKCKEGYSRLLEIGVAKECARFILPESTRTTLYMKGSIRDWIHYLQIRCDDHAQLEHRQVAKEIKEIFNTNFPNISKALMS